MKKNFLFAFTLLLGRNLHAYLDPGTGSYIIQVVIAAGLAGTYFMKSYLARAFYFITGIFKNKKQDESVEEEKSNN